MRRRSAPSSKRPSPTRGHRRPPGEDLGPALPAQARRRAGSGAWRATVTASTTSADATRELPQPAPSASEMAGPATSVAARAQGALADRRLPPALPLPAPVQVQLSTGYCRGTTSHALPAISSLWRAPSSPRPAPRLPKPHRRSAPSATAPNRHRSAAPTLAVAAPRRTPLSRPSPKAATNFIITAGRAKARPGSEGRDLPALSPARPSSRSGRWRGPP